MSKYKRKSVLAAAALTAILLTACGAANKGAVLRLPNRPKRQLQAKTQESLRWNMEM